MPPELTPVPDSYNWTLDDPFTVQDAILGTLVIPAGFVTDLGSIPRIFWNLIPPEGPGTTSYLIHDFLYATQTFTRLQSDDCLLRQLALAGVHWLTRYTIYWNLRSFGWVAWNADRKKIAVV